jgi:hypothetical protein
MMNIPGGQSLPFTLYSRALNPEIPIINATESAG